MIIFFFEKKCHEKEKATLTFEGTKISVTEGDKLT